MACRVSIDWKYSSAAIPPGVMTDMPFQLDAPGIYKVWHCPSHTWQDGRLTPQQASWKLRAPTWPACLSPMSEFLSLNSMAAS